MHRPRSVSLLLACIALFAYLVIDANVDPAPRAAAGPPAPPQPASVPAPGAQLSLSSAAPRSTASTTAHAVVPASWLRVRSAPLARLAPCPRASPALCCWDEPYCTRAGEGTIDKAWRYRTTADLSHLLDVLGDARVRTLRRLARQLRPQRAPEQTALELWIHTAGDSNGFIAFRTLLLLFAANLSAVTRTTTGGAEQMEYVGDHEGGSMGDRRLRLRLTFHKLQVVCIERPFPNASSASELGHLEELCRQLCGACLTTAADTSHAGSLPDILILNAGLWDVQDRDAATCGPHLRQLLSSLHRLFLGRRLHLVWMLALPTN
eukprot:6359038-Prymnesium_polylepis.1